MWSEDAGPPRPGRLDLGDDAIRLSGGSRDEPVQAAIPLAQLRSVRLGRNPHERLGGRATLRLELLDGRTISVAGVATLGALHELADRLTASL